MLSICRIQRLAPGQLMPCITAGQRTDWRVDQRRGVRPHNKVKLWKKVFLFPPDDVSSGQHHAHLPSLKQYQDEIEAVQNPVTITDIGLSHEQFLSAMGLPVDKDLVSRRSRRSKETKAAAATPDSGVDLSTLTSETLVKLVDVSVERKKLDYERLRLDYFRSEEGKRQTQELGHHYHIFRDLFSSPSQGPVEHPLPKVHMPSFKPYPDRILNDLFRDWFPGSVRYKNPDPRPIYHFTPHVPIHAEFAVSETKIAAEEERSEPGIDPDSLIASPVYRGNVITPLYASEKPSVVIDTRSQIAGDMDTAEPGTVVLTAEKVDTSFYTLALLNLDSTLGDEKPVCHWMISNMSGASGGSGDEVMPYMPVYGIRGLGYHRYVFLLMRHDKEISVDPVPDFVFSDRKLDPLQFVQQHSATPIGLSWFQSTWDSYSQKVFHHVLNMKSPVYEYIEPPENKVKQVKHPFAAPFNVYLDHFRDKRELNKEALLMRLKNVNPFDYSKEFEVDPIPNAYGEIRDIEPTWLQSTVWKQRNRLGPYRQLRPASAKLGNNNQADLDYPKWPPARRNYVLNKYPPNVKRWIPLRETKWVLPPNEHPQYRVDHTDDINDNNRIDAESKD